MTTTASPAPNRRPAILTPALDLLAVGGLSILLLVPLILSGRTDLVIVGVGAQAWIATTINMPHFMASYRLVYRDKATILKHKWASIGVPVLLLLWIGVALAQASWSTDMVALLVAVASAYLAWHYTGQVWGMMASFAYLEGARFERIERLLIRGSLRFLLVWHLTWFVHTQVQAVDIGGFYWALTIGTLAALVTGGIGLARMRTRIGRFPPLRATVAWLAIFVWYAAMARDPRAIFWVQIAHAIQYLGFPFRVEMNRSARKKAAGVATHMVLFGVALLGVSVLMAQVVPRATMHVIAEWLGERPGLVAPVLILSFINIHHYFTDGVMWKLRNKETRADLFAHFLPEAPDPVPPPASSAKAARKRRKKR